jgi:putative Ca2+/H+ antiporter (TMEM165/GDT1 family)
VGGHLSSLAVVARSAALFTVSEVGDKTMLATIALAAHGDAVAVWAGSTAGIVAAAAVAVLVGARLGDRLSQRVVRTGSAVVFAGMGIALLTRAGLQ